ncbi:hypothetical protein HK104_009710 [Borealophlyctis nickersoniae]|nr:hypothetical protein HK104_009710 [Borealophlyctis nickersoniae]
MSLIQLRLNAALVVLAFVGRVAPQSTGPCETTDRVCVESQTIAANTPFNLFLFVNNFGSIPLNTLSASLYQGDLQWLPQSEPCKIPLDPIQTWKAPLPFDGQLRGGSVRSVNMTIAVSERLKSSLATSNTFFFQVRDEGGTNCMTGPFTGGQKMTFVRLELPPATSNISAPSSTLSNGLPAPSATAAAPTHSVTTHPMPTNAVTDNSSNSSSINTAAIIGISASILFMAIVIAFLVFRSCRSRRTAADFKKRMGTSATSLVTPVTVGSLGHPRMHRSTSFLNDSTDDNNSVISHPGVVQPMVKFAPISQHPDTIHLSPPSQPTTSRLSNPFRNPSNPFADLNPNFSSDEARMVAAAFRGGLADPDLEWDRSSLRTVGSSASAEGSAIAVGSLGRHASQSR